MTAQAEAKSSENPFANGFPSPQYERLLRELLNADSAVTLSDLARRAGLPTARAGHYCDRLLAHGYVSKKPRDFRKAEGWVRTTVTVHFWSLARQGILYIAAKGIQPTPRINARADQAAGPRKHSTT